MKILYIDTTTSYLYTGIVVDHKLIAEVKEEFGKDLSSVALNKISEMLENNKLELNCSIYALNKTGTNYNNYDIYFISEDQGLTWNYQE